MIRRFEIEDLIVQDLSGVVFRALDTETGRIVALRRFFPFGADGGGLHPDEQTAYNIALGRLAGLSHPALRSVVSGGCDPVDGIPYIATEWIEGTVLDIVLEHGPLTACETVELLTQGLEVCELLSHVLAEEAVWVETDLQTIVLGSEKSGRGFTFWISPLKWLGGNEQARGLESIIALTEDIMNWKGRVVNDQAGRGLGGWLNWLRGAAATTSLREVRENLAAAEGADPPPPARQIVNAAKLAPPVRSGPATAKTPWFLALGLGLVVIGLIGWLLTSQHANSPKPPGGGGLDSGKTSEQTRVEERAATLSAQAAGARQADEAELAAQQALFESQGGVFTTDQAALLVRHKNRIASLKGTLLEIRPSTSGKTLYLFFTEKTDRDAPRGAIVVKNAPTSLSKDALAPLIGKKVRLTGKVVVRKDFGRERPEIEITNRAAIQLVD
ncbi:MAG: hypothetical protein Q8Q59_04185 [Luteolibacter sp.]|nr:hypothetical protein [Luteolibacter sp.]